ncbi:hypothetical protein EVAR_76076_1 [Eumeta japonica]|uniref:Uncharacterized protein n=1 Tax=Eumeta variegata TaxID=151549 RepID=A0A4C1W3Z0_EUMVA|nr:hypothetical protein EVAR_76076_1 [Eumeta japonica]
MSAAQDSSVAGVGGLVSSKSYDSSVKHLTLPCRGYKSTVALNVQRSWGGGNRKRQSESECVALERMRVVYLLQASASVSNE